MSPAKDEGSSRCKGKKVTADDPLAKIVGEESPLSKSDHFEKEEGGCDPNSECHPLINPWYNAYIHFPMVPSDYSPRPSGCVWLFICHHDTEVS